ncbi:MAG: hypothetical protein IAE98_03225 [Candidatus Kapabacteria bacterium]|nr:hypothetical protein [Candidatus Kapabacteria bacterium]
MADWNSDIVLDRDLKGNPVTNVPRRIIHHSPDGFEWGYGGSGPSDLALNILSLYVGGEIAFQHHQTFKWIFLAKMPITGGIIRQEIIKTWLASKGITLEVGASV